MTADHPGCQERVRTGALIGACNAALVGAAHAIPAAEAAPRLGAAGRLPGEGVGGGDGMFSPAPRGA